MSKTAILSSAAGLSIWAISSELYVVNEESIVAFSLLTVFVAIAKYGGPLYKQWADTHVARIRDVLNSARADHTQAVKDRIESVSQMSTVVEVTRDLFAVSKVRVFFFFLSLTAATYCCSGSDIVFFSFSQETAQLEAQAFQLEQQTGYAAEAKSVLDSWVRYEAQVKQRQQRELADSLIAKVKKELENPKTLSQILQQSVLDVESMFTSFPSSFFFSLSVLM